jgi:hypothetical protein
VPGGSERLLISVDVNGRFAALGHFPQVVEVDVTVIDVDIDGMGRLPLRTRVDSDRSAFEWPV